ncbi:hypothetical protein [Nonomuraea sp. B19D2]|uniref:hypothetical protein n=1 Tax=Nonomuraea sp. B19D2 TaxID=3159561 RepID=UPI0032DBCF0B
MLRLPKVVLTLKQAERYCAGDQVCSWTSGEHLVLDLTSEAEEEGELAPPVPPGPGSLSALQRALADFLRLDDDLLTAAAAASRPAQPVQHDRKALAAWMGALPAKRKDAQQESARRCRSGRNRTPESRRPVHAGTRSRSAPCVAAQGRCLPSSG